jgi:hypothetical protein
LTADAQVDLYLRASFCNDWPLISISGNDQIVWQDRVQESAVVSVRFPLTESNTVRIEYLNKRNGPDQWDTVSDQHGNILQDQHCVIDTVLVNRCRCSWLLKKMLYNYPDGSSKMIHGFMDLRGWYEFDFPLDVEQWVLENRRQELPHVSQNSSLAYETIYIPDNNNEQAARMVEELKILLHQVP